MGAGSATSVFQKSEETNETLLEELQLSKQELQIKSTSLLIPGYIRETSDSKKLNIDISAFYDTTLINIFAMHLEATYRIGIIGTRKQECFIEVFDYINVEPYDEKLGRHPMSIDTVINIKSSVQTIADKERFAQMKPIKALTEFNFSWKMKENDYDECIWKLGLKLSKHDVEDIIYHGCVHEDGIEQIENEMRISFTPYDELKFMLLKCRNIQSKLACELPFEVNINEKYDCKGQIWSINVKVERKTGLILNKTLRDIHVMVSVPTVDNQDMNIAISRGSIECGEYTIDWMIPKMKKRANDIYTLNVDQIMSAHIYSKWKQANNIRKCVKMKFMMQGTVGDKVLKYLKVTDNTNVVKWIKYSIFAGDYAFEF